MDKEIEDAKELFENVLKGYNGKKLIGVLTNEDDTAINSWVISDEKYPQILWEKYEKTKNNLKLILEDTIQMKYLLLDCLVIQEKNPELFEKMREEYSGARLIEIARKGNGNQLLYTIGNEDYEELLWERDNQRNLEKELIGSFISIRL